MVCAAAEKVRPVSPDTGERTISTARVFKGPRSQRRNLKDEKRTREEIRAEIAQVESEMRTAIDSGRMRSVERLRGRKQALGHELERAMAQEAAMGATTSTRCPPRPPRPHRAARGPSTSGAATARRQRGPAAGGTRK